MNKYITIGIAVTVFVICFNIIYRNMENGFRLQLLDQCNEKGYDYSYYYGLQQTECCIIKDDVGEQCVQVLWHGSFINGGFDIPDSSKLRNMHFEEVIKDD